MCPPMSPCFISISQKKNPSPDSRVWRFDLMAASIQRVFLDSLVKQTRVLWSSIRRLGAALERHDDITSSHGISLIVMPVST